MLKIKKKEEGGGKKKVKSSWPEGKQTREQKMSALASQCLYTACFFFSCLLYFLLSPVYVVFLSNQQKKSK